MAIAAYGKEKSEPVISSLSIIERGLMRNGWRATQKTRSNDFAPLIYSMKIVHLIVLPLLSVVLVCMTGTAAAQQKLYLFNWSNYMDPAIIKAFEKRYNVEVVRSFYQKNAELFAKLRSGGDGQYDVIFPSNYYVSRLAASGLIQPLNHSEIPNLDNLMPRFRNPKYDPHSRYSAAYQWGDDGIAYNTKSLPHAPDSWSLLFDPKVNPKYPFAMMTETEVMIGAACAYQGYGYGCTGENHWTQAAKLIMKTKKRSNFSSFMDGTPVLQQLARGSVDVAVVFNGDYAFAKKHDPKAFSNVKFIVPKEGGELWVDTMAIPAHAPHPKLANEFINFVLDAKIGAQLSNWNSYTSPNKAAQPYLNKELAKPPLMPTGAQMKKLEYLPLLKGKDLQFVQQLWSEVLSH